MCLLILSNIIHTIIQNVFNVWDHFVHFEGFNTFFGWGDVEWLTTSWPIMWHLAGCILNTIKLHLSTTLTKKSGNHLKRYQEVFILNKLLYTLHVSPSNIWFIYEYVSYSMINLKSILSAHKSSRGFERVIWCFISIHSAFIKW